MGAFAFFGLALALAFAGIGAQFFVRAASAPGVGAVGIADSRAGVAAGAVERYGSQCISAASGAPGLVATSIPVALGTAGGASVAAPAGSNCMTTAAPGGGRYVFAYAAFQPGMANYLTNNTQASTVWFRVVTSGQAQRLTDGAVMTVPTSIPSGSILNWVQVGF